MKEKTYTESAFDQIFQNKDKIEYNFDIKSGKFSKRDIKIIKYLNNFGIKDSKCLDICPGTGRWLSFFKQYNASYIAAIDISQQALIRSAPFCDKFQKANLEKEKFDFESDFFDVAISFMTLEHIKNPELFISEIIRVCKNNALLLMSIPNIVSLISRIRVLCGFLPQAISSDKTHIKFYTKKEIIQLFAPFRQTPILHPTSFSINPFNSKIFKIPSNRFTNSLDDHLLFSIIVSK